MAIKIMLVDDHAMIREGLKQLLELDGEIQVVSEAGDGESCLRQLEVYKPDVLLLDEPTNDLDVDTLRSLEEGIMSYPGCVFVTSHDRWFLDRLATHILAYEDEGHVEWFEGNFEEYEKDKRRRLGDDACNPHRMKYKKLER